MMQSYVPRADVIGGVISLRDKSPWDGFRVRVGGPPLNNDWPEKLPIRCELYSDKDGYIEFEPHGGNSGAVWLPTGNAHRHEYIIDLSKYKDVFPYLIGVWVTFP